MRALLSLAMACAAFAARAETLVIRNVDVVSMRDERIDRHQTVIVRGERIESIGPADSTPVPSGARIINGEGLWLAPGLVDSHVHIREDDLPAYLAAGVTTVRDLAGLDSVLDVARRINLGELRGPRIVTSTLLFNGPNPRNPFFSTVINNAAEADPRVAAQLARGCRFVKLYENLPRNVYDAIVSAARARGAPITGHVAVQIDLGHAMESQDSIEHLSGYERAVSLVPNAASMDIGAWQSVDRARYPALAEQSARSGVWNCPTLYVYASLSNFSQPIIDNRRAFVRELHGHGARLLAGTDAGYLLPAGSSLIDELHELVAAGLTPFEALAAATRDAALFLGEDAGTIEAGKRADLLLLGADPLQDIEALRHPAMVIVRGEAPPPAARRRAAAR